MGEMLGLNPEGIEKEIHPHALRRYEEWKGDVQREVPLEKLNDDDLDTFLYDDEKPTFQSCMDEISKWLMKCRGIGDGYSPYPYAKEVIHPMFEIKLLLRKVYQRKVEKAEEERRQREEEESWWTAYKALKIPADDAFTYLKPEEYEKFTDSILGVVDAYLAKGESYILDSRSDDYLLWINVIKNRREEEEKKTAAVVKAREFGHFLNMEINKLKSTLSPKKISIKDHFDEKIGDPRYTGHTLTGLLSEEQKQDLDATLKKIVRAELNQLMSDEFRRFVYWKYQYSYFLLPSVDYSCEGVPCLNFCFDTFAVIRAEIWIKPAEKEFGDYTFSLLVSEGKGSPVPLEAPEFLGYHYLVLDPSGLSGYVFWRSIPLVLIQGLMKGELGPAGTTISEASEAGTTYTIKGFEEQVTIPESFAGYLKEIGGIEQMVSIGIVSEKVADILKRRLGQSEAEQKIKPLQNEESVGYEDKDLVSSLTRLGISLKDTETLLPVIPKNLPLPEAIKFALRKHMKSYTNAQRES